MTIHRILVPTDFGAAAHAAVSYARELARATGAEVHLLHVVDDIATRFMEFPYARFTETQAAVEMSAQAQLDELARGVDPAGPPPHVAVLTSSAPANAIVGYAADEHIDLIVMGTHGRAPVVRMFLGAVADRVIRTAPCPVLTVREPRPAPHAADHEEAAMAVMK
jgi:nucleotide-binding universal stress UspA family protein